MGRRREMGDGKRRRMKVRRINEGRREEEDSSFLVHFLVSDWSELCSLLLTNHSPSLRKTS